MRRVRFIASTFVALAGCEDFVTGDPRTDAGATSDAVCLPNASARLIAPLAGSRVTGARVRLRWELPPEADGAEVVYCDRRDCTTGEAHPRQRVTGREAVSEYVPNGARPVYWRVVPLRRGARCGLQSPVWWYVPEPGGAAREGIAWRPVADVNADGIADFIASGHTARRTYVFLGSEGRGLATTPEIIERRDAVSFGHGLVLGDLDGDGLAELNIQESTREANPTLWIHHGAAGGFTATPTEILGPGVGSDHHAVGVSDLDGDGYGDLVTVAYYPTAMTSDGGRVYVYRGGPAPWRPVPEVLRAGSGEARILFGKHTSLADVNGDGRDDLFVSVFDASVYRVYLNEGGRFRGEPLVVESLGDQILAPDTYVGSAGDIDGDGRMDVMFIKGGQYVIVVYGSEPGRRPDFGRVTVLTAHGENFGSAVLPGDFDGGGLTDLVISTHHPNFTSTLRLFPGGPNGLATSATQRIELPDGFVGNTAAGDYNADGVLDMAIGEPDWQQGTGRCYWFRGEVSALSWAVRVSGWLSHTDGRARMGFSVW